MQLENATWCKLKHLAARCAATLSVIGPLSARLTVLSAGPWQPSCELQLAQVQLVGFELGCRLCCCAEKYLYVYIYVRWNVSVCDFKLIAATWKYDLMQLETYCCNLKFDCMRLETPHCNLKLRFDATWKQLAATWNMIVCYFKLENTTWCNLKRLDATWNMTSCNLK